MTDGNNNDCWVSRISSLQVPMNVQRAHQAVYERTEASIATSFANLQRALVDLQQLQIKTRDIMAKQAELLKTEILDDFEFEQNIRKINRSLESFTMHAGNLSHIKLTLARAANIVSTEGQLVQLLKVCLFFLHNMFVDVYDCICTGTTSIKCFKTNRCRTKHWTSQ